MADITYIDQYISDGKKSLISLSKFYDTILVTNDDNRNHVFRIPIDDLFLKYRQHFADTVIYHQVPEVMFYKPKMVSMELYGTTEMWISLLRLNGMRNVTEFTRPVIKIYNPGEIRELINIFFKREGKM